MKIRDALSKVKEAFQEAPCGFRFYSSEGYILIFNMETAQALEAAEQAVREMTKKRSLEDAGYFALQNELNEKLLVYNLILLAQEGEEESRLTDEDFREFREKTANCVLMDYGGYVGELLEIVCESEKPRFPKGLTRRDFRF